MSEIVRQRITRQLDWAERMGRCLVPENRNDQRALDRMGDALLQPVSGLYVRRSTWSRLVPDRRALHIMRALSHESGELTFCGTSAAVAHGLPVTWSLLGRVEASCPSFRRLPGGMRLRRLRNTEEVEVNGVRVTGLWRTVFDCLAELPFPDALAIADAALRKTGATSRQLVDYLRTHHAGERGVQRAVEIARFADGRAESGGESIARALMLELGFEMPELQVWIEDPIEPGKWFRVDFVWFDGDDALLIGELDGDQKTTRPELMGGRSALRVLQDASLREAHLTALRPKIMRFSYDDLLDRERFAALLDAYGVPRRSTILPQAPSGTTRRAEYLLLGDFRVLATEVDADWGEIAAQPTASARATHCGSLRDSA